MPDVKWTTAEMPDGRPVRVLGHRMYVRKLRRSGDDFLLEGDERKIGTMPSWLESDADRLLERVAGTMPMHYCEVLAVGERCGTARRKDELRKLNSFPGLPKVPRCLYNPSRPGDIVMLPESSPRGLMWRGVTGSKHEVFVDESDVQFIIPRESLEEPDGRRDA